jgi:glycopeptide antibiotics resistance protein
MLSFRNLPIITLAILIYIPIFIKLKKNKACVEKHIIALSFYIYLAKVFDVAFLPIFLHGGFKDTVQFNLIPLQTIITDISKFFLDDEWFIIRPLAFNLLMFVPMGYLLPLITRKLSTFSKVVIISSGISLMIEIFQLITSLLYGFTFRYANVDDIIINTLGSAIGFLLLKLTFPFVNKYINIDLSYLPFSHLSKSQKI